MMKRNLFLTICILGALGLRGQLPEKKGWQQRVDFELQVSLNDLEHNLTGMATIHYFNHSPDTLPFIWIHLWPNAYKNDKTAFSEQKLLAGQTEFYFSNHNQKGYINRLDFKINEVSLLQEDHPQHQDIIKLILPEPLAPGGEVKISTPFNVQLPNDFSRLKHIQQHYAITQWYPKPAMYDHKGWHPMPYLEWGEYYNDFGNYRVSITLPQNYVVGATGNLLNEAEKAWMKTRKAAIEAPVDATAKRNIYQIKKKDNYFPPSATQTKTLVYEANNVTDFAWFADKRFLVKFDTLSISNKTVETWNLLLPEDETRWKQSLEFTKRALKFYSNELGPYPYPQVSVVAEDNDKGGGMEYPMITYLNHRKADNELLDILITHEIGHNWLQGMLSTNERKHAWMDEGMNTYFENKYKKQYYHKDPDPKGLLAKFPENETDWLLDIAESQKALPPIDNPASETGFMPYVHTVYTKAGLWMQKLEQEIGTETMNRLMQTYFQEWGFKHPYPEDFKAMAEKISDKNLNDHFALLNNKEPIVLSPEKEQQTKLAFLFNYRNTANTRYINVTPAFGYNGYDGFQTGLLFHNYNLPQRPFQFVAAPLFGTNSKQLTGLGRMGYHWYPKNGFHKAEVFAIVSRFNTDAGIAENYSKLFKGFTKVVPGFRLDWKPASLLSQQKRWLDFRTYFISEGEFEFFQRPAPNDDQFFNQTAKNFLTVIPQMSLGWANERALYPWKAELTIQQVKQIVRTSFTGNYFLNYNKKNQGLAVRLFVGKIIYTQQKTGLLRSQNSRYHFTMQAPNGWQDYTYSNAFIDRQQSPDIGGRQIMIRDGGFKYRSDYSSVVPGLKTNGVDYFDNWMATLNLDLDLPDRINPLRFIRQPILIFADVGSSASPWQTGSNQPRFLYSMGLHLPVLKCLHFYYPLLQSKAFKEPNSVNAPDRPGGPNWWQKRLTFSMEVETLKQVLEKLMR